jgi:hypothetical protein
MNFAIKHYNKHFYQNVGADDHHYRLDDVAAYILVSDVGMHSRA